MTLKQLFHQLVSKYSSDEKLTEKLWNEIETNYLSTKRYYHNLVHLENLFQQLIPLKDKIQDWETMQFSIFYHDAVYNTLKSDNEEKSAKLAQKRMNELNINNSIIEKSTNQILATKKHESNIDSDTNYFTDADLSVFGSEWAIYQKYLQDIRKEYFIYPDFMYNSGRKKVLAKILEMDRIYKTDYFFDKYEYSARQNLKNEILFLTK